MVARYDQSRSDSDTNASRVERRDRAAGAILVALPTVLVYLLLQRHFVRGLTLGATKG